MEPKGEGCDQTADHCGFQGNHSINVWRSKTLASGSWEFVAEIMPEAERPASHNIFRPDAIYNPNTNMWVLWVNYVYFNGSYAGCWAATAAAPGGPFILAKSLVNTTTNTGDFHLFVDPHDGHNTGYVIYSSNWVILIEKLQPDYLSITSAKDVFVFDQDPYDYWSEAPMLFERNGVYYALFSWCCCYCLQGSGIIVHTAPHPLGPWERLGGNIACEPGSPYVPPNHAPFDSLNWNGSVSPTAGQGCQRNDPSTTSQTRAQQNFIATIDTPSGQEFLWIGDRWQQSWDGTKGHDPQTFLPLFFSDEGSIMPVTWLDRFSMDVV